MTNSYNSSAEYLNKMRQELASKKSAGSALISTTPEYVLPVTEASSISDDVTATSAVIGTYKLVNNTHLIAHLPLQLDTYDAIGTNHGTVTGTEQYGDGPRISPRKLRKAFDFNNTSYIILDNPPNFDFDITSAFSLSCFVKFDDIGTNSGLITKNDSVQVNTGWGLHRASTDDLIKFHCKPSTSSVATISSTTVTVPNRWYHIGATKSTVANKSGMNLYVDSILEATGSALSMTGVLTNAQSVTVGAESDGGVTMDGQICGVQIWDVELTAAEMITLASGNQINRDSGATDPAVIGMSDMT